MSGPAAALDIATSHWGYEQFTGALIDPDGVQIATGYAGAGAGVDNPADQAVANVGPIPQGSYTIGNAFDHPVCGALSMRLLPMPGTDTFGRSGFLMHGDNRAANHTASEGCIVIEPGARAKVAASAVRVLVVGA